MIYIINKCFRVDSEETKIYYKELENKIDDISKVTPRKEWSNYQESIFFLGTNSIKFDVNQYIKTGILNTPENNLFAFEFPEVCETIGATRMYDIIFGIKVKENGSIPKLVDNSIENTLHFKELKLKNGIYQIGESGFPCIAFGKNDVQIHCDSPFIVIAIQIDSNERLTLARSKLDWFN